MENISKIRVGVFVLRNELNQSEVLLAKKKLGFGKDKWQIYAGKPKENEEFIDAAVRELEEESGLKLKKSDFEYRGKIEYEFQANCKNSFVLHIYAIQNQNLIGKETEEMGKPKWFKYDKLPCEMWFDAHFWMEWVIIGYAVKAKFVFNKLGKLVNAPVHAFCPEKLNDKIVE